MASDAADFTIEGGVLMFKESPDYEMAMDDGPNNMYIRYRPGH